MIRPVHLPALLAACLTASAFAGVDHVKPILNELECPGRFNRPEQVVIPEVTTGRDQYGRTIVANLIYKDWNPPGTDTARLRAVRMCAYTPEGHFMGGSVLNYTPGSRFRITTSEDKSMGAIPLVSLLSPTTVDLRDRQFQIEFGAEEYDARFSADLEQVSGGTYATFTRAPVPSQDFTAMYDPGRGWESSTYYIRSLNPKGGSCRMRIEYLDANGLLMDIEEKSLTLYTRLEYDPGPRSSYFEPDYRSIVFRDGTCAAISFMRVLKLKTPTGGTHGNAVNASGY